MFGICAPWATIEDLCEPCLSAGYVTLDTDFMERKLREASELLYMLSGKQFEGVCMETIRPCSRRYYSQLSSNDYGIAESMIPFRFGGFLPACGCHSSDICTCLDLPAVDLRSDVLDVTEVQVDGDIFTDYELRDQSVVRTDGNAWPCCDTPFYITYEYGHEVPETGVTAAGVLACELYLNARPSDIPNAKCRLPRNIQSVARQGVSVIFNSLTKTRRDTPFRFGIWEIDLFLEAFNPLGQTNASNIVLSPDDPPTGQRVP